MILSWRKFEDLEVNNIEIDTDNIEDGIFYIDFTHFPSKEFETIGDSVATITCESVSEKDVEKIIRNLKENFDIPIGTKDEIYG